mmetsp:Transcript_9402/g.14353  ORF Transcript_9402/g.14353 Transcript_9402/m.14353 type:complete len:170 (+) Transcript_9402:5648-6157(+)
MRNLLPPYILHLMAIQCTIWVSEKQRASLFFNEGDSDTDYWKLVATLSQSVCSLINFINMLTFGRQSLHLKQLVFQRMWSIMDIVIILCNLIIFFQLWFTINVETLRVFETVLTVFIWFKSLYFFRLVGEIAPLVDIIFVILNDIKYFMVIFVVVLIAFIQAFYIVGQN